eukprot:4845844-Prymnesium_polylepis.1
MARAADGSGQELRKQQGRGVGAWVGGCVLLPPWPLAPPVRRKGPKAGCDGDVRLPHVSTHLDHMLLETVHVLGFASFATTNAR